MTPDPTARPFTPPVILFLAAVALAVGALSLALGQDANWDLRNYHWYNAYAFWTGRWAIDVAPSQVPAFYNPTLDLPFYWLAEALPARWVGFIMGVVNGLNAVPLYGIAWAVLPLSDRRRRALAAGTLAVVGLVGGGHVGLIGTTFYDNVISLFVLGSAWVVVANADAVFRGPAPRAFALLAFAGLLVGSGVGLKQPTVVFAVGLCFAFLLVEGGFWRRMFQSFFFGIGVLAGMAVFSGHWMWFLWTEFQNPLFPYFNDVFRSPMGTLATYRDDKWLPESLGEALAFPFLWTADPKQVGEIAFRDLRVPVAYLVLIATPILWLAARARGAARPVPAAVRYLLIAMALSYLVWLKLFAIYRYLIPLEMLAPVAIVAAIAIWPIPVRARAVTAAALLALVTVTAQPGNWNRIAWTDRFVEIQAPPLANPDDTLILMTGYAPTSFLVHGFPPQVPFLRLQSYLIHPDHGDVGLNRKMADRIATHDGDMFLLLAHWEVWTIDNVLPHYGLTADATACAPVTSNLDEPMMLCPVRRLG